MIVNKDDNSKMKSLVITDDIKRIAIVMKNNGWWVSNLHMLLGHGKCIDRQLI